MYIKLELQILSLFLNYYSVVNLLSLCNKIMYIMSSTMRPDYNFKIDCLRPSLDIVLSPHRT